MRFSQHKHQTGLPSGFLAIPIREAESHATLQLCVVVSVEPTAASGHLVLLRDLPDTMVYLGCVVDAAGRLREWVELSVQNLDGLDSVLPAQREMFSNKAMDERWSKISESLLNLGRGSVIVTGWEDKHPLPTLIDLKEKRPVHPATRDGFWELCEDDVALKAVGLPPFGTSLFRYLSCSQSTEERTFIPAVSGSPTNPFTRRMLEVSPETSNFIPFNPQAGFIRSQVFSPLSYEDYIDLLGGKAWKGFIHGKHPIQFDGVYKELDDWTQIQQSGKFLFLGNRGLAGRFIETFHLKLQALTNAVRLAHDFVNEHQLPFLNLSAESFRVHLTDVGDQLPSFWTAKTSLVNPSLAYALPVDAGDFRYFVRARGENSSVYYPEGMNQLQQGSGVVRIRTVLPPDQGRTAVEGTLVMQHAAHVSPHDLLWIRLPLQGRRLDLFGHLYTTDGLAEGEARFRTLAQSFPSETSIALRAAEGVTFPPSGFQVVPLLSTPCDLHALGVLAIRTFLVNPQNSLPVAFDELLSLGRETARIEAHGASLPARVESILKADLRFAKALGPHRLIQEKMEPSQGFELLPPQLWCSLLATIIRLIPGLGPDSYCKDHGDAPPLALETVMARPLEELQVLLQKSRSLIMIDWNLNREIHSAIRDVQARI